MNNKMYAGAQIIIKDWMKAKKDETVLIITDELHMEEATYLHKVAIEVGSKAMVLAIDSLNPQKGEIHDIVSYAMLNSDAIIAATTYSITTTKVKKAAVEKGARFLSLPMSSKEGTSILESEFIKTNIEETKNMSHNMNNIIDQGNYIRVTTPTGTDVTFDITGRYCELFSGECCYSGQSASSSFELYIPPIETKTVGRAIIDASLGYLGAVTTPFEIIIEDGNIIQIEKNKDGIRLEEYIESFEDPNMYTTCEFGIGLNKRAKCIGNSYIEDESTYGTFHIGFGRNVALGGNHYAKGHFDLVMNNPTISVDDIVIIRDGEIIV